MSDGQPGHPVLRSSLQTSSLIAFISAVKYVMWKLHVSPVS